MGEVRKIRVQSGVAKRDRQRGSVMLVAMVTLSGLLAVATVTMVKVKRGIRASSQSRFQSVALFSAESGISAAMDFLRTNRDPLENFSGFVSANNGSIQTPPGLPGNDVPHGDINSLFTGDIPMSYRVSILNNPEDPGFARADDDASPQDTDGIVILRSVGYGPGTSMVVLEVKVNGGDSRNTSRVCPGYAQRGMAEDGAGRNDCLGAIDETDQTTFSPGNNP